MESMIVDVIIPTYKPDEKLRHLIYRLENQSYEIRKIYIMNTVAGKFPKDVIEEYGNIQKVDIVPEEFDHGGTRDQGAKFSDADILLFMTQDAVPCNHELVSNLVKAFEDERVAASYARQLPEKDCDLIEKFTRQFNYPKESRVKSLADLQVLGIKTFFCSNVCAAYRREYYDAMGGFVHDAIFNEDMIMAGRMIKSGYSIAYAADAEVIHSHNYNCMQQFRRNFDVAVSQVTYSDVFGGIHSENEGIRLVKQTAAFLFQARKPWLIVSLVVRSGFKYIGYRMGKKI